MRKFRFRLESVLRYRRRIEEMKESAFARAHRNRLIAEAQAADLERTRQTVATMELGVDLETRRRREIYLIRLDDLIAAQHQLVEILMRDEDAARKEWLAARREVKALEELRARALRRHEAEVLREEQRDLDEWAILTRKPSPQPSRLGRERKTR
ncbi:MAG: flagellar export protein FliJ [Fimbriimonadia bacterium]